MQIELPTFVKTPSVKSFFDVVLASTHHHHRKFSFSSGAKVAAPPVSSNSTGEVGLEDVVRRLSISNCVAIKTPQEEQSDVIQKLNDYLTALLASDDEVQEKSCFLGTAVPPISILDYIERLVKYVNQWAEDEPCASSTGVRCCLMAVEYLERTKVRLAPRSVHRYFLAAVLMAIKTTEDFAISNKFWGDVGGCKVEDVNRMEVAFCKLLEWNFEVSSEAFVTQQSRFSSPCF